MIIDQESHARKSQLDPERDVPVVTASTPLLPTESPPAYTPREGAAPSSSSTLPLYNSSSPAVTPKRSQDLAAQRFFNALLLAFGLYAAIAVAFKSLFFMIRGPPHPHRMQGYPEPEDGRVLRCIVGGDTPWLPAAPTQFPPFGIPLNSNAISIISRGQQGTGRVQVELDQMNVNNEITVDITAQYHDWDALSGTTVCLMEREEGELRVGVFTPKRVTWTNRRTKFDIIVKIPYQASPVEISQLEILTPNFQVILPEANKFVHFHKLTIHTSGMPVAIDSVNATHIDVQTSNADIHGTFITNSSLSLKTSEAQITANIFLENDGVGGRETSVHATTTSGSLTGAISLLPSTGTPRYKVRTATTNAGLNISFLQHSDSSHLSSPPILDIIGTTSNGPAELLLQSPFEGSFDISTSPTHHADFLSGSGPKRDPLGLGRQQNIRFTTNAKSRKEGRVFWGDLDDGRELGRVELSTSNGLASLHL
ncbi:hypothetical protein BJ322DRAFT_1114681 [Thelephora terrestris]|uniref:Uncharacterized protein n=1 Tax=Thelephora terrestris TaxID=56493 RepID=A0A9P6L122_9AGAM|nr:hypothetical protein BJ322DRAFT_1114681 [Thelephora terrestris]